MMPRRPAVITSRIPLFLIASVVSRAVKKAGEELVRIVVKKMQGHCCNISVRTRTVCRVLRPAVPQTRTMDFFEVTT
jgi:hypothetical protein